MKINFNSDDTLPVNKIEMSKCLSHEWSVNIEKLIISRN